MKLAKTSRVGTNDNVELVQEIQAQIIRINNLLQFRHRAEYFVDLMNPELIQHYGRQTIEAVVRPMLERPVEDPELSKKFSGFGDGFKERYFNDFPFLAPLRVKVVYRIGDETEFVPPVFDETKVVIEIPAGSESLMVARVACELFWRSISDMEPFRSYDPFMEELNRLFAEGAPMTVDPKTRSWSAEQFIAAATREPVTEEEDVNPLYNTPPKADQEAEA